MTAALGSIAALYIFAISGCAHQKPAPAPPQPKEPVVVKVPAAEQVQPAPVATPESDLDAVLSGAVLQFEFDRAVLTAESTHRLDRIAEAMRAYPRARVKISGHCDERGTQEYNVTLGQQRAQAARAYLMALGIDGARVETVSYGAEVPLDRGQGEQAWAKNRRDEFSRIR